MAGFEEAAPIGVVCDDRSDVRRSVTALLLRCGFDVVGEPAGFTALRETIRAVQPAVAVVGLPLDGLTGLAAVTALREDCQACHIVLLSPFGQLQVAALEAGAAALVSEDDLQSLQAVLRGFSLVRRAAVGQILPLPDQRPRADAAYEGAQAAPLS